MTWLKLNVFWFFLKIWNRKIGSVLASLMYSTSFSPLLKFLVRPTVLLSGITWTSRDISPLLGIPARNPSLCCLSGTQGGQTPRLQTKICEQKERCNTSSHYFRNMPPSLFQLVFRDVSSEVAEVLKCNCSSFVRVDGCFKHQFRSMVFIVVLF